DFTADFFTADLRVIWRYAPGSDISFVWKQSIAELASSATGDYFSNLTELMRFPQQNSFSLRLNYFLDYSSLSRHFVKNSTEQKEIPAEPRFPLFHDFLLKTC